MTKKLCTINLAVVIQHAAKQEDKPCYLNKERATELLQTIGQNIAQYYPQIQNFGLIGGGLNLSSTPDCASKLSDLCPVI